MSNVFADLPELLDIASDGSDSTLTTPVAVYNCNGLPGILSAPDVPFAAFDNLELLEIWRDATRRMHASGNTSTPPISDFLRVAGQLPVLERAPTPSNAPAVSRAPIAVPPNTPTGYDFDDAVSNVRPCFMCHARGYEPCFVCHAKGYLADDEQTASTIPRIATPAPPAVTQVSFVQEDREPRPYFISGDSFLRYDSLNATELPTCQKRSAPLSIEWQPLKTPVTRVATPIPTATRAALRRPAGLAGSYFYRRRRDDREITDTSSMYEVMAAFQAIGHAYISTINKIYNMTDDERDGVMDVLQALLPSTGKPQPIEAVAAVIRVAFHVYGIDYKLRLRGGREVWLRDIDLWRSPNARVSVLHYWTTRRASITVQDIDRLLTLPQYSGEDGMFLIKLRHKIRNGINDPVPVFADLPSKD